MKEISTSRQIGLAIREERLRKSLTQQQLADLAGVSRGFINRIEKGSAAAVYPDKLFAVLNALKLKLALVETPEDDGARLEDAPSRMRHYLDVSDSMQNSPSIMRTIEVANRVQASVPDYVKAVAEKLSATQANLNLPDTSPLFAPRDDSQRPNSEREE